MEPAAVLSPEELLVFETLPDLYLILSPDLVILTASQAYLQAAGTRRAAIVGRSLAQALPDHLLLVDAGVLAGSLQQVLATKKPQKMALQPYRLPGEMVQKCWRPLNTPVLDEQGQIRYLIHKVEDVTTQNKVAANLKRAERIVNAIPEACYELDHNGTFIFVNQQAQTLFGKTKEELIGRNVWDIFPEARNSPCFEAIQINALGKNKFSQFEYVSTVLGTWISLSATPTGQGCIVLFHEIEDLKQARQKLQESNDLLRAVFDATLQALAVFKTVRDPQGRFLDLEYVLADALTRSYAGGKELVGKNYSQVFPGARESGVLDRLQNVVETATSADFEIFYPYEGFNQWFRIVAVKLGDGLVVTSENITERKKAEARMAEQALYIQHVVENVPDTVFIYDAADHRVLLANPGVRRLVGYTPAEMQAFGAGGVQRLILADDLPHQTHLLQAVRHLANGQVQQTEYRLRRKDGELRWVHARRTVLKRDEHGQVRQVIAILHDITPLKEAQQQVTKNLTLLRQAEAVAQMGSWDYDLATGAFTWSEGMYHLFGLPAGSPVSLETYLDKALPEDRAIAEKIVRHLRQGRKPLTETLRIRVDNQVLTLKVKGLVVRDQKGQPVKMLGVDVDISEVKRLEQENLQMRLTQQKALLLAILEAQEEERRRIAESLHNGVGQILYATKLHLNQVELLVAKTAGPHNQALQTTQNLLAEAIKETRLVSHELVPVLLKDFGLEVALQDLCSKYSQSSIQLRCQIADLQQRLEPYQEIALYRISQELVNNVVRHASASRASLRLRTQREKIVLQVQDNGQGFSYEAGKTKGLGLQTIRDRVLLLNGTLAITRPKTGNGTLITVRVPVLS